MKALSIRLAIVLGMTMVAFNCNPAEEDNPIMDNDIHYTKYEEIQYPPLARQTRIQGVVVVKVHLGEHGEVIQASAISGHELLIESAVANANQTLDTQ
jgi:hypothetical protein